MTTLLIGSQPTAPSRAAGSQRCRQVHWTVFVLRLTKRRSWLSRDLPSSFMLTSSCCSLYFFLFCFHLKNLLFVAILYYCKEGSVGPSTAKTKTGIHTMQRSPQYISTHVVYVSVQIGFVHPKPIVWHCLSIWKISNGSRGYMQMPWKTSTQ